ncbi:MAG: radical SAM family heme chaperone HemW [Anaerolineae bacterium]|nr:radical SAM family heme chaperone HemW [Anaerolineae bacterium]
MNTNIAPTLGMYIHIPWCPTRCIYCDFNTYVDGGPDLKAGYQAALLREIRESGAMLKRPALNTIFFGGGTPTTLTPAQLVRLVDTVKESFDLQPEAEITVEANPGTLSLSYLSELRQGGINRLSLGVQSFNDYELKFLSRLHNSHEACKAVENARTAGFNNLSLDLIFNLPHQTLEQWQSNLYEALKLEPDHLSIYSLIIEPGTPLHRQVTQGNVPQPDDDIAADMYAATIDMLAKVGYVQYEISNWAKHDGEPHWQTPALASAHNLIYWRNQSYLGIGAGAFGTINGQRWANVKRPQSYMGRVNTGGQLGLARDEETFESITPETAMAEHMMLGLRLVREGVSAQAFEARFGVALEKHYAEAVAYGLERKLTEWIDSPTGPRLRLTHQGRFLANQVVVQFVE